MERADQGPDPDRAQIKYQKLAGGYDRLIAGAVGCLSGLAAHRAQAIDRLNLRPGDRVVDVGCGTGLRFAAILRRIGHAGSLIGVEQSPEMLAVADSRVERHGWTNVQLVASAVEDAQIGEAADAALFGLVHDITRSRPALDNILGQLADGARIAVFGGKTMPGPFKPISRRILAWYVTTFDGADRPWTLLQEFVPDLTVVEAVAPHLPGLGANSTGHSRRTRRLRGRSASRMLTRQLLRE